MDTDGKVLRLNVRMPDELHQWISCRAGQSRCSMTAFVVAALEEHRDNQHTRDLDKAVAKFLEKQEIPSGAALVYDWHSDNMGATLSFKSAEGEEGFLARVRLNG